MPKKPKAYIVRESRCQGKSFHEKAGHSQGGFVFTYRESLPLSQAASDAILPSALFCER